MIILDTHVLAWVDWEERKLGRRARVLVNGHWEQGEVAVSALSFWELGMLVERGRVRLPAPLEPWRAQLLDAGLVELPVDGIVAIRAAELSGLLRDPADRLIASTAIVHAATLLTADEKILGWRHPLPRHDARL